MKNKTLLSFEDMLPELKQGSSFTRVAWSSDIMWVSLTAPKSSHWIMAEDGMITKNTSGMQYFVRHESDGDYQPGWLPTASDLLATDWYKVDRIL